VSDSINIELVLDGNAWGAMIGPNLQEGISGWGDRPSEALPLRDLATQIDSEEWTPTSRGTRPPGGTFSELPEGLEF